MKLASRHVILLIALWSCAACSGRNQFRAVSLSIRGSELGEGPTPQLPPTAPLPSPHPFRPEPAPAPIPPSPAPPSPAPTPVERPGSGPDSAVAAAQDHAPFPLSWEGPAVHGSRPHQDWSDYVFNLIDTELANQFLGGAEDIEQFCPQYNTLDNKLRANFWAALVAAISRQESGDDPVAGSIEKTMGVDPVTGMQVRSEGLLQLSYQDTTGWSFCHFDWQVDKDLKVDDPKKTILDPFRNLDCGMRILAQQVQQKHRITLEDGVYWAVLKVGGKYQKIAEIAQMTQAMIPPCRKADSATAAPTGEAATNPLASN